MFNSNVFFKRFFHITCFSLSILGLFGSFSLSGMKNKRAMAIEKKKKIEKKKELVKNELMKNLKVSVYFTNAFAKKLSEKKKMKKNINAKLDLSEVLKILLKEENASEISSPILEKFIIDAMEQEEVLRNEFFVFLKNLEKDEKKNLKKDKKKKKLPIIYDSVSDDDTDSDEDADSDSDSDEDEVPSLSVGILQRKKLNESKGVWVSEFKYKIPTITNGIYKKKDCTKECCIKKLPGCPNVAVIHVPCISQEDWGKNKNKKKYDHWSGNVCPFHSIKNSEILASSGSPIDLIKKLNSKETKKDIEKTVKKGYKLLNKKKPEFLGAGQMVKINKSRGYSNKIVNIKSPNSFILRSIISETIGLGDGDIFYSLQLKLKALKKNDDPRKRFKNQKTTEVLMLNVGSHWIAVRLEHIPQELQKKFGFEYAIIFADSLPDFNYEKIFDSKDEDIRGINNHEWYFKEIAKAFGMGTLRQTQDDSDEDDSDEDDSE
ncbi:hypothetical protein ACFLYU_03835 [Candidatus Dependentiae bacterium]